MARYEERLIVRKLRQEGLSISEIIKKTGVGKSTVSNWCSDILLSESQITRIKEKMNKRGQIGRIIAAENRKRERIARMSTYCRTGKEKIEKINKNELFLVGTALYWAEGGKKQRKVTFINSDLRMILVWLRWVNVCLEIPNDRLVARLEINDQYRSSEREVIKYWSTKTGIPKAQFTKTSFKHTILQKKYSNNDGYYGSLQITIKRGTNLNYEILGYIQGLADAAVNPT